MAFKKYKDEFLGSSRQEYGSPANIELFRATFESGQSGIKAAFLLNGGAALAILAFVGQLATSKAVFAPHQWAWALSWFTIGVGVAALISGLTYFTLWSYAKDHRRWVYSLQVMNCVLFVLSFTCFFLGVWMSFEAFVAYSIQS